MKTALAVHDNEQELDNDETSRGWTPTMTAVGVSSRTSKRWASPCGIDALWWLQNCA